MCFINFRIFFADLAVSCSGENRVQLIRMLVSNLEIDDFRKVQGIASHLKRKHRNEERSRFEDIREDEAFWWEHNEAVSIAVIRKIYLVFIGNHKIILTFIVLATSYGLGGTNKDI